MPKFTLALFLSVLFFSNSAYAQAPDSTTTLSCTTTRGTDIVSSGDVVDCTVTPMNGGVGITGNATQFTPVATSNPSYTTTPYDDTVQPIITFSITMPTYSGSPSTITVVVQDSLAVTLVTLNLTLLGTPAATSTLACVGGPALQTNVARQSQTVACTITFRDSGGALTTGVPGDLGTLSASPSASVSGATYVSANAYSQVTFNAVAPAVPGATFRIRGALSNMVSFTQGYVAIAVKGTPSSSSTMVCVSSGGDSSNVRVTDVITCTIYPATSGGARTTGFAADFVDPIISPAITPVFSALTTSDGGSTFVTSFTTPSSSLLIVGTTVTLTGVLSAGNVSFTTSMTMPYVGTPAAYSTLACTGATTLTAYVHTLETINCVVTLFDSSNNATTGYASDVGTPTISLGSSLTAVVAPAGSFDSTLTFTFVAPTVATTVTVTLTLADGTTALTNSPFSVYVRSTPTTASTLSCMGTVTNTSNMVRAGETTRCTITARSGSGLIEAILTDFGTPSVVGGTSLSAYSYESAGNYSMIVFTIVAPAAGASFFVRGRLASNTYFSQSALSITVTGTATVHSTLSCLGQSSGQTRIRRGDTVTCTITPRDNSNSAIQCFAADFDSPIVVNGVTPLASAITTSDSGHTFTVSFASWANLTSEDMVSVTGTIAGGTPFTTPSSNLSIVGTPTQNSTLTCVGQATNAAYVYPSQLAACTITVRDNNGPTTGFGDDFAEAQTVGGTSVSLPAPNSDGSQMTFTLSAPSTAGANFTVTGVLAGSGLTFYQGPFSLLVMDTASRTSTLACVALRLHRANVRAGEDVTCVITIRNSNSALSTALPSDFNTPVLQGTGAVMSSSLVSAASYTQIDFNVTAPSTPGTIFSVTGRLANNVLFNQGAIYITVVGNPDASSLISCVGTVSASAIVRASELVDCRINMRAGSTSTTGDITDFGTPIVVGTATSLSALQTVSLSQLNFSIVAPAVPGAQFALVGTLVSATNFSQGQYSLTVVGAPTDASVVSCVGARSGTLYIQPSETLLCTITLNDGSGSTTGFATDASVVFTSNLVTASSFVISNDNTRIFVNLSATSLVSGATFSPIFSISRLGYSANFTQTPLVVTILSVPTANSTIACSGVRSQTLYVHANELIACTISAYDSHNHTATTIPLDFLAPTITPSNAAVAATVVYGSQGAVTQQINLTSQAVLGVFTIQGKLSDGTSFLQSPAFSMTVTGTPDVPTTINCQGIRSGSTQVRINELVACTITIKNAGGIADTGVAADFLTPTITNGVMASSLITSANLHSVSFNVTAGSTVGSTMTILLRLTETGSSITQGAFSITIVGSPSSASTVSCVGSVSNAGINVRPLEIVNCVITAKDDLGVAAIATPADFGATVVVGGTDISALVAGSASNLILFNVTAPGNVSAAFSVTGVLANGTLFLQGALVMDVAYFPDLLSWTFSLNNDNSSGYDIGALLTLNFRATVNLASFNVSALSISNSDSFSPSYTYRLTGGTFSSAYSPSDLTQQLVLSVADTEALKLLSKNSFLSSPSNTYLSISANSGLKDAVVLSDEHRVLKGNTSLQATTVTPDTTAPFLTSFQLFNKNLSLFQLVFNEPVLVSSFDSSAIMLGKSYTDTHAIQLSPNTNLTVPDGDSIIVQLSAADISALDLSRIICSDVTLCFISFTSSMITDIHGNPVVAIPQALSLTTLQLRQPVTFISDTTGPAVTSYSLNMTDGTLTMTFSKLVSGVSVVPKGLVLQAQQSNIALTSSQTFTLTGGTVSGTNSDVQVITFLPSDLLSIKSKLMATSTADTYLAVPSGFVYDLSLPTANGNQIIPGTAALRASAFYGDTVRPTMSGGFSLHLDTNTMVLSFDEPVLAASLNVSLLTLQNAASSPTATYPIVSAVSVTGDRTQTLTLTLTPAFVLSVTSNSAGGTTATTLSNTYLRLGSSGDVVSDVAHNMISGGVSIACVQLVRNPVGPQLMEYTVNMDGAAPYLDLYFSAPVSNESFVASAFRVLNASSSPVASYLLTSSTTVMALNTTVMRLLLGTDDTNNIKASSGGLLLSRSTSYLAMTAFAFQDYSFPPLNVLPVLASAPMQASAYVNDTTAPTVVAFAVDMTTGVMTLTFSEPLQRGGLAVAHLGLSSGAPSNVVYMLTTASTISYSGMLTATVTIHSTDLAAIANRYPLATSAGTALLVVDSTFAMDVSGNAITAVSGLAPTNGFVARKLQPRLVAFDLNLVERTLVLTFSTPVNGSTLDVTQVVLQSTAVASSAGTKSLRLVDAIVMAVAGDSLNATVTVVLGQTDMDSLQVLAGLARSQATTYVSISSMLVVAGDGSANVAIASNAAQQAAAYVGDTVLVALVSWSLNLSVDPAQMVLSFSKVVSASTLQVSTLSLQDVSNSNANSVSLSGSTVQTGQAPSHSISVLLDASVTAAMKYGGLVCTADTRCYLVYANTSVQDYFGNYAVGNSAANGANVTTYTADMLSPSLVSFVSINMQTRQLVLSFTEPVNVSSFVCTDVVLQTLYSSPISSVTLGNNGGGCTATGSAQNTVVTVAMSTNDVNAIELDSFVCTQRSTCYVQFGSQLVKDMAGNAVTAIGSAAPGKIALSFVVDTTAPTLTGYDLDMRLGTLMMHFSKPIADLTLQSARIALQPGVNVSNGAASPLRISLSSGYSVSAGNMNVTADKQTVLLVLSLTDVNNIKAVKTLAKSRESTYMVVGSNMVKDLVSVPAANAFAVIADGAAVEATTYTADDVPPELVLASLDMANAVLMLQFNEPMLGTGLNVSGIVIQETATSAANSVRLSVSGGLSYGQGTDGSMIVGVRLGSVDLVNLKTTGLLASSQNTTFVALDYGTVLDMANNSVVVVPSSQAVEVSQYIANSNLARLRNFSLDMNAGVMVLTFTDLVNPSTFVASGLSLQSSMSVTSSLSINRATLSSTSTSNSSVGFTMTVYLSEADIVAIKLATATARALGSTYLMLVGAVLDYRGNDVLAVTNGFAMRAWAYTADTTPPQLTGFSFNASDVSLVLTFSKAVLDSSMSVVAVTLQNAGSSATASLVLSVDATHAVNSVDFKQVRVVGSVADQIGLKSQPTLCTSAGNCYVSVTSLLVTDLIGQAVVAISTSAALAVNVFTADTIAPVIVSFDLSLTAQTLTLHMSKVVNASSLNSAAGTLSLFSANSGGGSGLLLNGWTLASTSGTQVVLALSGADFVLLKSQTSVAVSNTTTYLQATAALLSDYAGNAVAALVSGSRLRVSTFVGDNVSPALVSFGLDMSTGVLTLLFSEPVNPASLVVSELQLLDMAGVGASGVASLSAYNVSTALSVTVTITLDAATMNLIKSQPSLCRSRSSTYLNGTAGFVQDTSFGNGVGVVSGMQAATFVADNVAPVVVSASLDLSVGVLSLTFNQVMNVTGTVATLVTVQDSSTVGGAVAAVTLASGTTVTAGLPYGGNNAAVSEILNLTLISSDRELIALSGVLGRPLVQATYVALHVGSVHDMMGNTLQSNVVVVVSHTVGDTLPPHVVQFGLDLTTRVLTLSFSKSVNASSLAVSQLMLLSASAAGVGVQQFALVALGSTVTSGNGLVQTINIGVSNANGVLALPPLCVAQGSCYLQIGAGSAQDMYGNAVAGPAVVVGPATPYVGSTATPLLTAFALNLNTGSVQLTFSQTVNGSSLVATHLVLQDRSGVSPVEMLRVSAPYTIDSFGTNAAYSTVVTVTLNNNDLNQLKNSTLLAKNANTTYAVADAGLVLSMMGSIGSASVAGGAAIEATSIVHDTTGPTLVGWAVDYNVGVVTLVFDELVNGATVTMSNIVLQTQATAVVGSTAALSSGSTVNSPMIGEMLTLSLSGANWNSGEALQTSANLAYVVLQAGAVQDLAGNGVAAMGTGMLATSFVGHAAPVLLSASVNMNAGTVTLLFNRSMLVTFVDTAKVFLQSEDGTVNVSLSSSTVTPSGSNDTRIVMIAVADTVLSAIKSTASVGKNASSSVVVLLGGAVVDGTLNAKGNAPTVQTAATFVADTTAPLLTSVAVDMNQGLVTLNFNEPLSEATGWEINVSGFRAQHNLTTTNPSMPGAYALTTGTSATTTNGLQWVLHLSAHDVDGIMVDAGQSIFRSPSTAVVGVYAGAVHDVAGNAIAAVSLLAGSFVGDANVPQLLSFDFDMNSGILSLAFSKVMSSQSFNSNSCLYMQSNSNSSVSGSYAVPLLNSTVLSGDGRIVTLSLTPAVLHNLKAHLVGITNTSTWLRLCSLTLNDTLGHPVFALIDGVNTMMVSSYLGDSVAPSVASFDLIVDEGVVVRFSEPILFVSLVPAMFVLSIANSGPANVNLSASTLSYLTADSVLFSFGDYEMNLVKSLLLSGFTLPTNTYLSVSAAAFLDVSHNAGVASLYLAAETVFAGTRPPAVEFYSISLNGSITITLIFNETVNIASLNPVNGGWTISAPSVPAAYTLTSGGTVVHSNWTSVVVQLSTADANAILSTPGLARSLGSSLLVFTAQTVSDNSGNALTAYNSPLAPNVYTPDTTPPTLVSFTLDKSLGILTLSFSESVQAALLNVTALTLSTENNVHTSSSALTLTGGVVSPLSWVAVVNVTLASYDLNRIQLEQFLGTQTLTTFLSFTDEFVLDTFNNAIVGTYPHALRAASVGQDTIVPVLTNATLNMTSATLVLTFSKAMDMVTFNVTDIAFGGAVSDGGSGSVFKTVHLSSNAVVTSDLFDTVVTVVVAASDMNLIDRTFNSNVANAVLYNGAPFVFLCSSALIRDTSGNHLAASNKTFFQFTVDMNRPNLVSFVLNVELGVLTLSFDKAMSFATLNSSTLTNELVLIDNAANNVNSTSSLAIGPITLLSNNSVATSAVFSIRTADLEALKLLDTLCIHTDVSTCYIALAENFMRDTVGNNINAIALSSPLQASALVSDSTRPTMLAFTSLNMSTGVFTLSFSEPMQTSNVNFTGIVFMSTPDGSGGGVSHAIGANTIVHRGDSNHNMLVFNLADDDLDYFKLNQICASQLSCWIKVYANAMTDMAGNAVVAVLPSNTPILDSSRLVATYAADTVRPVLASFVLDMTLNAVYFTFSEPVKAISFRPQSIVTLQNNANHGLSTALFTLTTSPTLTVDGRVMATNLSSLDVLYLKSFGNLGNYVNDTFVYFASSFVTDLATSANPILPVVVVAIAAQSVVRDTLPPVATAVTEYNQYEESFTMVFDKGVDISRLFVSGFTLCSSSLCVVNYTLGAVDTRAVYVGTVALKTSIKVYLGVNDIRGVKALLTIGVSQASSYIFTHVGALVDMFGNPIQAQTLGAQSYIASMAGVTMIGFDFNLSTGIIALHFDDILQASTLDPTKLTLQSMQNASGSRQTLTGGSTPSVNGVDIVLVMSKADLNLLKYNRQIGFSADTTFISLASGLMQNTNGQSVTVIAQSAARPVGTYARDIVDPVLSQFSLNLNTNELLFTFSEPVDLTSFAPVAGLIVLQNAVSLPSISYTITSNASAASLVSISNNNALIGCVVSLNLSVSPLVHVGSDWYFIKSNLAAFFTSPSSSVVMSAAPLLVTDLYNNAMAAPFLGVANSTTADTTAPKITSFSLSLTAETLVLSFDEPVTLQNFNVRQVTLLAAASSTILYQLTGGRTSMVNQADPVASNVSASDVITIQLILADLNAIKATVGLAKALANTWLAVAVGVAQDTSGNPSAAILSSAALQTSVYVADTVAPSLLAFAVNMNSSLIVLHFSEVIRSQSFVASAFTLYSNVSGRTVTLSSPSSAVVVSTPAFTDTLVISMGATDINAVKSTAALCSDASNCFLYLNAAGGVLDVANNALVTANVDVNHPLAVFNFTADQVRPELVSFVADMNAGMLLLTFTEPINASAVAVGAISAQGRAQLPTFTLALTGSIVNSTTGTVMVVVLSSGTLNFIRINQTLFTSLATTFLTFTSAAFMDVAGNAVVAIANPAQQASLYLNDTTAPQIIGFDLNMNTGLITLSMSAVVNPLSLNASGIGLQQEQTQVAAAVYTLSPNWTLISQSPDLTVTFQIGSADLNSLKMRDIALSPSTAWLSASSSVVRSVANLGSRSVSIANAIRVSQFVNDTTSPTLVSFDYDANLGLLNLEFTEAMAYGSFAASGLTLMSAPLSVPGRQYTLTSGSHLCRLCTANEYINASCGRNSYLCSSCSVCPPATYTATACTANANTVCNACTTCNSSQYIALACSGHSDTVCQACSSSCPADHFQSAACTAFSDRVCSHCAACDAGSYLQTACTATSNSVCAACSSCGVGQYIGSDCSLSSDTSCSTCTTCTAGSTWAKRACSTKADTVCAACSTCGADEFVASACTVGSNTVCQSCQACSAGSYQAAPCTNTSDATCTTCSTCPAGTYVNTSCTATQDTQCASCSAGCATCTADGNGGCTACQSGYYLYNGLCYQQCPSDTFTDSQSHTCGRCHQSCATCTSGPYSLQCLSCPSSLQYSFGSCSAPSQCASNTYWTGSACAPCAANCSTCMGASATQCLTCPVGYVRDYRTCYPSGSCPAGTYEDVPSGQCLSCPDNCLACSSSSSGSCTLCNSNTVLVGGVCNAGCPSTRYARVM